MTDETRPTIHIKVTFGKHTFEAKRTLSLDATLADAIVTLGNEVVTVAAQIQSVIKSKARRDG